MQLLCGRTAAVAQLVVSCDGRFVMAGTSFRHVWDLHDPKAKPRVISAGDANDWDLDVQFLTATRLFVRTVQTPGWYCHDLETGVTTDLMRPPALPWEQICVYPPSKTLKVLAGSQPNIRELTTYRVLSDGFDLIDTKRSPIGSLCGFSPAKTRYLERPEGMKASSRLGPYNGGTSSKESQP